MKQKKNNGRGRREWETKQEAKSFVDKIIKRSKQTYKQRNGEKERGKD